MNKDSLRQWVNVIAVIATIAVNGLANLLPFNGQTTAEISNRFEVYFVPAGYVFSIWGLIYVALLAFAVYQALPAQRTNPRLRRIGPLFVLSCLANSLWLLLWHYEFFVLTLVVMVILLLLLIAIYLRLRVGHEPATAGEKWFVQRPFQIYLGWITVATIANATAVLAYLQWDGWGIAPEVWAVLMLLVGLIIGTMMVFRRRDIAYVLVLVWAFVGIAIKQADAPTVAGTAWAVAALLVVAAVAAIYRGRQTVPAW